MLESMYRIRFIFGSSVSGRIGLDISGWMWVLVRRCRRSSSIAGFLVFGVLSKCLELHGIRCGFAVMMSPAEGRLLGR